MSKKYFLIILIALIFLGAIIFTLVIRHASPTCEFGACNSCEERNGVCKTECNNETIRLPGIECEEKNKVCCLPYTE